MTQLRSQSCKDARLKRELAIDFDDEEGVKKTVRLVQELLRLHGISVVIDGDLGPATKAGLSRFCRSTGGVFRDIDQDLVDALARPLLEAAEPSSAKQGESLGQTVAATARRHLKHHPLEIGGPNRGPWVRFYMSGSEGPNYPWCAGFVTYVVRQAAAAHGVSSPITRTFSCDDIGMEAKRKTGKFVAKVSPTRAPVGSVFLVPHGTNKNDWVHTGIIVEPELAGRSEVFCTIEGNTNDEGSREGFEVCERYRACSKVDVVLL